MFDCDIKRKDKPLNLLDIYDLLLDPIEPNYLVEGLIEDHTTGALIGEAASGKSFIAISLACSVITGISFASQKVRRQGPVIYIAGEGRQGIPRRVQAWQDHHQVMILKNQLFMPRVSVQLDASGAKQISEAIDLLVLKHGEPALIIIDTLARTLPAGRDENSSKDMMAFLNIIDGLRDRFNCVALIVHHTGHGEESKSRARGSSSFRAAMDWEFLVDKKKGLLRATKMKDADLPDPIRYEISKSSESAVVFFGEVVSDKTQALTKTESLGLKILKETFIRLGQQHATTEEWRDDFYSSTKYNSTGTKRTNFNRARDGLVSKGVLDFKDEIYSLARQSTQCTTISLESREDLGDTNDTCPCKGRDVVSSLVPIIKDTGGDGGRDPP